MGTICTHQQMVGQAGLHTGFSHPFLPLLRSPPSPAECSVRIFSQLENGSNPCGACLVSTCSRCSLLQFAPLHNLALIRPAQLPNTVPELGTPSEEEIRTKTAYWHVECSGDWDRQTHMTKKEWADTCQRIVADRVQWLRSQDHLESLYGP